MKDIKEILKEFLEKNPNGSKNDFVKYFRQKEAEFIEQKFTEYKNKQIKELKKGLYEK